MTLQMDMFQLLYLVRIMQWQPENHRVPFRFICLSIELVYTLLILDRIMYMNLQNFTWTTWTWFRFFLIHCFEWSSSHCCKDELNCFNHIDNMCILEFVRMIRMLSCKMPYKSSNTAYSFPHLVKVKLPACNLTILFMNPKQCACVQDD
jgi:hypothetical protein